MEKDFLGTGWHFPVALDETAGGIAMVSREQDIEQSIIIILSTAKGERLMRPDFGCGIQGFVFQVMNTATTTLIGHSVREALTQWEPRITLESVRVEAGRSAESLCLIHIDYTVRATNDRRNLVYPFYMKQ